MGEKFDSRNCTGCHKNAQRPNSQVEKNLTYPLEIWLKRYQIKINKLVFRYLLNFVTVRNRHRKKKKKKCAK